MEIRLPVEFIVTGTPVSLQTKKSASREAWKLRIRSASEAVLPQGYFSTESPLSMTLYYFPAAEMQGDIDNIVKPVLDALSGQLYRDDKQVERVLVQKFERGRTFDFANPSDTLLQALGGRAPLLYVRVEDVPLEGLV